MAETIFIHDVSDFFNRFNILEKFLRNSRIEKIINSSSVLFRDFQSLSTRYDEYLAKEAPEYNLFDILHIRHYETKVHSPFLKHLLDPYENHKQDRLFFNAFMKSIFNESYDSNAISDINVLRKEFRFINEQYSGQIDILIHYKNNTVKKELLIENKIYHKDEPSQLEKYYGYLSKDRKLEKGNYTMVYLKPHRCAPSSDSIL